MKLGAGSETEKMAREAELSRIRDTLMDPDKRRQYDAALAAEAAEKARPSSTTASTVEKKVEAEPKKVGAEPTVKTKLNPYDILGVKTDALIDRIDRAYKLHVAARDINRFKTDIERKYAKELFDDQDAAYAILSDPDKEKSMMMKF